MQSDLNNINLSLSLALQEEHHSLLRNHLDTFLEPLEEVLSQIEKGSVQAKQEELEEVEIKLSIIQWGNDKANQKLDALIKRIQKISSENLSKALEESFIEIPQSQDSGPEEFTSLPKRESSGKGPSFFDYALSGAHTAAAHLFQKKVDNSDLKSLNCEENFSEGLLAAISSLRNYSSQCRTSDINAFFYLLEKERGLSCQVMKTFYYPSQKNFNELTCKEALDSITQFLKKCDLKKPVAIPLVYGSKLFHGCESQHIAAILIQEGRLSYYDPRGITSNNKKLHDGSLKEVLKGISTWLQERGEKVSLSENRRVHQKRDSHLCGLFVMNFFYKKLCKPARTPLFSDSLDSHAVYSELEAFRGKLLKGYLQLAKANKKN